MYCSCSAAYADAEPNTHVCPICLGLPGALPVINEAAIETVIRTGLALDCTIPPRCKLDRKNYVYPDLPKGYQISQYDMPLCVDGALVYDVEGQPRRAGITRVHIEEDTGRLLHPESAVGTTVSLIDLNRSGVPLMEIVGDPDLRSPEEAREYLIALRQILRYIGASNGNMEEGAFRCDANISTRALDGSTVGPKVEIKNMNSFRAVERALRYEEQRQRAALDTGESLVQETRGWVEGKDITVAQRTKEQAHDYRYFPEPDLPPLTITQEIVHDVTATLPELPMPRRIRVQRDYGLSAPDAAQLTQERGIADIFEEAVDGQGSEHARAVATWMLNDVMGLARVRGLAADELPVSATQLTDLVVSIQRQTLTARAAKEVLPQLGEGELPSEAAARLNLLSMDDQDAVRSAAMESIRANQAAVADYKNGKSAAIGRLIGETMKRTSGRARPDVVRTVLVALLESEDSLIPPT
ncbi:MAG: Asp-tRNA(Asn)/Glu-tRNA(Gln) amidotransferase subunit GatB [Gemmatimonadota bacterium]|nr:Asp-tRNA(Asn)/Glu-tRNA(Gln) amidotransferase subunit GatB [Gemmatimonadota bacterium]